MPKEITVDLGNTYALLDQEIASQGGSFKEKEHASCEYPGSSR